MEEKRKGFEEERKSLLVPTQGDMKMTLDQEKTRPGELQLTKELLILRLLQLAVTKEEAIFPLCFEAKPLGQQSLCLGFETKRKEEETQRKEEETKRKNQMKMTKGFEKTRK